jgi:hypothetical protein
MLEPYSIIQDKVSHGDIIVRPLKALNDYIEATGDIGFLDEKVAWRREDTLEQTARTGVRVPIETLISFAYFANWGKKRSICFNRLWPFCKLRDSPRSALEPSLSRPGSHAAEGNRGSQRRKRPLAFSTPPFCQEA